MGKNLTQQKRGKGSTAFRSPGFKFLGKVSHRSYTKNEVEGVNRGKIMDILHSPAHSGPVAKVMFEDKESSLMLAPTGVRVGDMVESGAAAAPANGNTLPLSKIPDGREIYNIESQPGDGGKFVRTSGISGTVLSKSQEKVLVLLPSKEKKEFNTNCRATIGVIAGSGRVEKPMLKAGAMHFKMKARNRYYPKVSAGAMNAVDHPYGGSSSQHKGKPRIARKYAPAGAKVGKLKPSRTGRRNK